MLTVLLSPGAVRAQQEAQATSLKIDLRADQVRYYSDQQVIEARGKVRVALSNGVLVKGDACIVNLGLRRLVVAGHVHALTPAGEYIGAALADFMQFRRVYFIPLDGVPDRWTFLNDDYAHPEKGREMPGDAFFLPDFSEMQPFVTGTRAYVDPENYIQFTPSRFVFLNGRVRTPPLPTYVRNFSENQNFSVNSLSGATFDVPYGFSGSSNSLDAVHYRYDPQRKTYFAIEHHSVFGETGYGVFSLNPATQPAKQWNVLVYSGNGNTALNVAAQLFTFQSGLSQPLASNGFVDAQLTHALRGSAFRLEVTQSYESLLAPSPRGYYGDPSHAFVPNHPLVLGASWFGYDKRIARTGLSFRLTSGLAEIHDAYGISTTGKSDADSRYVSGLFYTPVYRAPFGTGANLSYQLQRTWLSFPNRVDAQTLALSDSKRFSNKFALTISLVYQSVFTHDINALYASPSSATGLAPQPTSPNGLPPLAGVVTQFPDVRNTAEVVTAAWQPSPNFQFTAVAQENYYTPLQAPFIAGPARYQATGDMRTRLSKTLFLDVARTYYFNWANQRWSPAFALQVSAQ